MASYRGEREAFGQPGLEPHWTHGNKEGIGTAYSFDSQCWFTLWNGVLTEAYYPTVDRPQLRDLQYLITHGETLFQEEKRDLRSRTDEVPERALEYRVVGADPLGRCAIISETEVVSADALEYRVVNSDPKGRYAIIKKIITDPFFSCILQHTRLEGDEGFLKEMQLYALCNPHLDVGGKENNAYVVRIAGREVLAAEKGGIWMALAATIPFSRLSCGYVGKSDGWTDLADNCRMDWEFDRALAGNVAMMGELDLRGRREFTLGLAFGLSLANAVTKLSQALATPFEESEERYTAQWRGAQEKLLPLEKVSGDQGMLYRSSCSVLSAHEDKAYPGAIIASLSIPWGEARGDQDRGGYHLVWGRDMAQGATGLLAAGDTEAPFRALGYLSAIQQPDGGFPQNSWVDGTPYWSGIQLDETAAPILLAWRLHRQHALKGFDPYPMVTQAAGYLIHHGPATQEERWEEASGYSPSTLGVTIAALICAACLARERSDAATARYLEEYADFLESHLEDWMATTEGTLVPGISHYFMRINPASVQDPRPDENPNHGTLTIPNRPPGSQTQFPAKEVVGPGFLTLVRYGIRKPDDPLILASLKVVDALLKVETPLGPCWHRYNHDGYGQRPDGGPYVSWGQGRAWPLLTAERGQYELAAGHDVGPYVRALERFGGRTGLLPEQVWDEPDRPEAGLYFGRPTGSARPLVWAHAEYVKLLRSVRDGQPFDLIPEVAQRYLHGRGGRTAVEVWKFNRRVPAIRKGRTLRVQAPAAFRLRWSRDDWATREDTDSSGTHLGIEYVDVPIPARQQAPVRFTFFWTKKERWEGRDYEVAIY